MYSDLSDPNRAVRERGARIREVISEVAKVLLLISPRLRSGNMGEIELTVAVSYQCMAMASTVQLVQLPRNSWSHSTPWALVTAGPTSFAFPAKGSMLVNQSAAAAAGVRFASPPLSGSLNPSRCVAPAARAAFAALTQLSALEPQLNHQ